MLPSSRFVSSPCASYACNFAPPTPPPSPPSTPRAPRSLQVLSLQSVVLGLLRAIQREDGRFLGQQLARMPSGLLRDTYGAVLDACEIMPPRRPSPTSPLAGFPSLDCKDHATADALFRLRCRLYAELHEIPCPVDDTFRDYRERLLSLPFLRRLPTCEEYRHQHRMSPEQTAAHGPAPPPPPNACGFWHARVPRRDMAILASLPTRSAPCFASSPTHYASHYAYVCTTCDGERVTVCGLCRRSPLIRHRGPIETAVAVYDRRDLVERLLRNRNNWCSLCGRAALFVLWSFDSSAASRRNRATIANDGLRHRAAVVSFDEAASTNNERVRSRCSTRHGPSCAHQIAEQRPTLRRPISRGGCCCSVL